VKASSKRSKFACAVEGLSNNPSWAAIMWRTSLDETWQLPSLSLDVEGENSSVEIWRMAASVEQSEATVVCQA
jgi:hypothetical protein